jgi:serine/threonine protein kinase
VSPEKRVVSLEKDTSSTLAGKYRVVRELGRGSSGVVYLVEHGDLNVTYALKVLNNSTAKASKFIELFKREAETLLKFTHEGCVQLRDFGRLESGHYYMATDYCEGSTLKEVVQRTGRLGVAYSLTLLCQLLKVLAAAHERGIVHRDIKPENIMLEKDFKGRDVIKVLDFGIAKLLEMEQSSENGGEPDHGSLGTPSYMSPEQAYGEPNLDARIDIYSAGVVGYEMLTGHPPFLGDNVVQTLIAHITQPPDPFAEKLNIPSSVEKVIFRALEKNRDSRYATASLFSDACQRVLDEIEKESVRTLPAGRPITLESAASSIQFDHVIDLPKTKILVLDDEKMLLTLMKHILEHEGYEVFTAPDCSAIHPYLFEHDVRLLITDICMPDIPGWKICRMLKESIPNLKIVLFSNLPDEELERLHQESRSDAWISKGAKPNQWLPIIRNVLKTAE